MRARRSQLDDEVLELLADEPELLAIADAVVETQRPRRRVRPVGVVASAVVLAAVVALAFALWPDGGSHGISDSTAVAAIGGEARLVTARFDDRPGPGDAALRPGAWPADRRWAAAGARSGCPTGDCHRRRRAFRRA